MTRLFFERLFMWPLCVCVGTAQCGETGCADLVPPLQLVNTEGRQGLLQLRVKPVCMRVCVCVLGSAALPRGCCWITRQEAIKTDPAVQLSIRMSDITVKCQAKCCITFKCVTNKQVSQCVVRCKTQPECCSFSWECFFIFLKWK